MLNLLPILGDLAAHASSTELKTRPKTRAQFLRLTFPRSAVDAVPGINGLVDAGVAFRVRTGRVRRDFDGSRWTESTSRGPAHVHGALLVEVPLS
jgi:hypothetical protein